METKNINLSNKKIKNLTKDGKKNLYANTLNIEVIDRATGQKTIQNIVKRENANSYNLTIPILNLSSTKRPITEANFKKLLKNNIIQYKGYDKQSKTFKNYDVKLTKKYIDENNLNIRFENNNNLIGSYSGFDKSGGEFTRVLNMPNTLPLNFMGTREELFENINNMVYNHLRSITKDFVNGDGDEIYENIISIELNPITFLDKNNLDITYIFKSFVDNEESEFLEKRRKHIELTQIYNEDIKPVNNPSHINCCVYYFDEKYKTTKRKIFKNICEKLKIIEKDKKQITNKDLFKIFDEEDITVYIWSIDGEIYAKENEKYTKTSKLPSIFIYIEDNHIYEVISKDKKKRMTFKKNEYNEYNKYNLKYFDKITENLLGCSVLNYSLTNDNEFFNAKKNDKNNDKLKLNLLLNDGKNILTNNKQILKYEKIFEFYKIDKKLLFEKPSLFIKKIFYDIKFYSIFPFIRNSGALQYSNIENKKLNNIKLLDKNLCYSSCLKNLPFIPYFNVFCDKYYEYSKHKIIEHYLYYINVNTPNEIYNNNNYYFGWYLLKYGYDNENIKIKYVFECEILKDDKNEKINPFTKHIENLFDNVDITDKDIKNFIKLGLNSYIGKMSMKTTREHITPTEYGRLIKENDINQILKRKLLNSDIQDIDNVNIIDDKINIDDNYFLKKIDNLFMVAEKRKNISWTYGTDNKPLHIFIINYANSLVVDVLQKLKIDKTDILEINTDGIKINNADKYNFDEYINKNKIYIDNWKLEDVKPSNLKFKNYYYYENSKEIIPDSVFYKTNNNNYEFNIQLAGGGKTYTIKEKIKNELEKNKEYSYIILSPFNDFLTEYRKEGFNNSTIAKYIYDISKIREIKEKNIYIDEFGICSMNEFLFLLRHTNKNFYFYGDLKQLKPVMNKKKLIFDELEKIGTVNTKWTNKRNKFTEKFYNNLINNGSNAELIIEMLKKYNSPKEEAEIIIAYTNETVNKYNKYMMNLKNKKFEENEISIDIPIINKLNNNIVKNAENNENETIFNKHSFTITKKLKNNEYVINDGFKEFIIEKDNLLKNFEIAYCRTLYNIQGKTLKSFHYAEEDINYLSMDGALYTLISRLKQ